MFAFQPALTWLMTGFGWFPDDRAPTDTHRHTHTQYYKDSNTQLLSRTHPAITASTVPLQYLPFISKTNLRGWLLSSMGRHLRGRKYFPERQTQNFSDSHACQVYSPPPSREILVCFGNAQHRAPDTFLTDINLIKMICPSSVINQAKQNDKWEIILWRKSQNSSPVELPEHLIWLTGPGPFINTLLILATSTYVSFGRMEPEIISWERL